MRRSHGYLQRALVTRRRGPTQRARSVPPVERQPDGDAAPDRAASGHGALSSDHGVAFGPLLPAWPTPTSRVSAALWAPGCHRLADIATSSRKRPCGRPVVTFRSKGRAKRSGQQSGGGAVAMPGGPVPRAVPAGCGLARLGRGRVGGGCLGGDLSGGGVDQCGDLDGVVGEYAQAAPGLGAAEAVEQGAVEAVLTLQVGDPAFAAGPLLDELAETAAVFGGAPGLAGLALAGDRDGRDAKLA